MKLAILSDIHAGLGADNPGLRHLQTAAVERTTAYLHDQNIDVLVLDGDTTDHLDNDLSGGTDRQVALEVLAPLVSVIKDRRRKMKTIVLPGNTDWPIGESDAQAKEVFFEYTGLAQEDIETPGLSKEFETDDAIITVTHGHMMKPDYWKSVKRPISFEDGRAIWNRINHPNKQLLKLISSTHGSHRNDYIKAMVVGSVVTLMPRAVRAKVNNLLGPVFTKQYEQFYSEMLYVIAEQTHKKILGVAGHTHVAGVRRYDDMTILNTGTAGAKPNPLQHLSDPKAHMAMIDTEIGTYTLIQTFNAARPNAKPEGVYRGDFAGL